MILFHNFVWKYCEILSGPCPYLALVALSGAYAPGSKVSRIIGAHEPPLYGNPVNLEEDIYEIYNTRSFLSMYDVAICVQGMLYPNSILNHIPQK
jgi:hypothetical protein